MPLLLVDINLIPLCFRQRCQFVCYLRQSGLDRLLVLNCRLDNLAEWRDEVKARPLVKRRNFAGSLLVDREGIIGKERIARYRLLPQILDGFVRWIISSSLPEIRGGGDPLNKIHS